MTMEHRAARATTATATRLSTAATMIAAVIRPRKRRAKTIVRVIALRQETTARATPGAGIAAATRVAATAVTAAVARGVMGVIARLSVAKPAPLAARCLACRP